MSSLCNGLLYKCDSCKLYLDARCASLPSAIRHEAHHHPLLLTERCMNGIFANDEWCSACHRRSLMCRFRCKACGFNLHAWCALLTIKHRYDEHPFILNYSPVKDHLDNYCCEICCEEGYPKSWFYHCDDCDHASVL